MFDHPPQKRCPGGRGGRHRFRMLRCEGASQDMTGLYTIVRPNKKKKEVRFLSQAVMPKPNFEFEGWIGCAGRPGGGGEAHLPCGRCGASHGRKWTNLLEGSGAKRERELCPLSPPVRRFRQGELGGAPSLAIMFLHLPSQRWRRLCCRLLGRKRGKKKESHNHPHVHGPCLPLIY